MTPRVKVIHTSDGDKLRDAKTNRLAGSLTKKPRAPKAKNKDTGKLIEASRGNFSEETDSVSKAAQKFKANSKVASTQTNALSLHTRKPAFSIYGESGLEDPRVTARILHQHVMTGHQRYPGENPVDLDMRDPYNPEAIVLGDRLYDYVDVWHKELHNRELDDYLANPEAKVEVHYHANDYSNDPTLRWVSVSELRRYIVNGGEFDENEEEPEELFARKLEEAKRDGLDKAIKLYGILEPITISPATNVEEEGWDDGYGNIVYSNAYIVNGFHRVAVALDIDPNMLVPIKDRNWII